MAKFEKNYPWLVLAMGLNVLFMKAVEMIAFKMFKLYVPRIVFDFLFLALLCLYFVLIFLNKKDHKKGMIILLIAMVILLLMMAASYVDYTGILKKDLKPPPITDFKTEKSAPLGKWPGEDPDGEKD